MSDEDAPALGRRAFLGTAAAAAGAAATANTAAAQEGDVVEVEVDNYVYNPPGQGETLYIEPGTTVRFTWVTDNHDIIVEEQPEGANWEGVPTTEDTGFVHEHTFDVLGTYYFFCSPHIGLGMDAYIEVTEDVPDEVPVARAIPEEAMTLGIATSFALIATLGFAYVFLKYGGQPTDGE